LKNPNLVRAFDAVTTSDHLGITTELLSGPTLEAAIHNGDHEPDAAVSTMMKILSALQSMHPPVDEIDLLLSTVNDELDLPDSDRERLAELRAQGLVHRDVKPQNIVLVEDRGPVLVDFGLASGFGQARVGGTPAYQPPDAHPGSARPGDDLFACGVILHELLTGQHPYSDLDLLKGELVVAQELDDGLRRVIERACAPRAEDRFRSANDFLAELVALGFDDAPTLAPEVASVQRFEAIRSAMRNQQWEEARELCDPSWSRMLDRIERAEQSFASAASSEVLFEFGELKLVVDGEEPFDQTTDTDGSMLGPGTLRRYLVSGPDNLLLGLDLFVVEEDGVQLLNCSATYDTDPAVAKALHNRMRLRTLPGTTAVELRLAKRSERASKGWAGHKTTLTELCDFAQEDVELRLSEFGTQAIGTREHIYGDAGPRRSDLCILPGAASDHMLAVAFVLTRVAPVLYSST
jgi:serine/threonine protein kinase